MAGRYKVTFESLDYVQSSGYKRYDYMVHTCLDERKAIVMATMVHMSAHPQSRIYQVVGIERLDGADAKSTDIVDRMEY